MRLVGPCVTKVTSQVTPELMTGLGEDGDGIFRSCLACWPPLVTCACGMAVMQGALVHSRGTQSVGQGLGSNISNLAGYLNWHEQRLTCLLDRQCNS